MDPAGGGYVDIHSHILHGLDDGAADVEESVALLSLAASRGTTHIVATPHANTRYRYQPDLIDQQLEALRARTPIQLYRGCDFHLQPDNIDDALAHPGKYAINGRCYLLVEFPSQTIFPNSDEILLQLLDAGLVPIVSHPERNRVLSRQPETLRRWIERGCCVQVTAASFGGLFGAAARASAIKLMEAGLIQIVASDAHDVVHRTPDLHGTYAQLAKAYGADRVRPLFVDNPLAVIAGEPLDLALVAKPVARRWYQFWR